MKRFVMLATLAAFVFGMVGIATAATEVRMVGDARIHANWYSNYQFTGWNRAGTRTVDPVTIWERFRLRTDFIANESLKFRLGLKVEDVWGGGTFTADNSAVAVQVYQAYVQFKWPDTDITITAGYQPMSMPQSSFFNGSVVVDTDIAGIGITVPVVEDTFNVVFGFVRYLDTNGQSDTTTTQVADELDSFFLVLPITLDGFSITPWGTVGIAGIAANSGVFEDGNMAGVTSAATFMLAPVGWKNNQNFYWWAGCAFEADAFDPIKLYADVIYGEGVRADYDKNKRWGWFIDGAIEYTGLDMLTPQLSAWWSSGEDGSTRNGSERMPYVVPAWNASTSFLFDGGQQFKNGTVDVNPIGSWGITAALANISFIEDLSSRITFTYARGTNSKTALRDANLVLGTNNYFIMGKDLAVNEYVLGLSFDHEYMIYENLALIAETGWAHGEFDKNVWGRRFYNAAGDMWKVSIGLKYQF
ncbi:outer membrane homotrimeric porin [Desulfovibrio inopinatus]|uniref:outer membrane homotrimeric porin n=1 Tax=Desulfovibrio inopinatus TaxID=102109 RepID=UPI0003FDA88D|nr:outer membrane homotrimeric porin [Desulfovibrio inopinatus]